MSNDEFSKRGIAVGTRIYYTGDAANLPDFGTVMRINPPCRFAPSGTVDIRLDDGREFRGIYPSYFDPAPGRRFMTEAEYRKDRQTRIEAMQRDFAALKARKEDQ